MSEQPPPQDDDTQALLNQRERLEGLTAQLREFIGEGPAPLYGRPFVDSDGNTTGLEVLGVVRSTGTTPDIWSEVAIEYLSPLGGLSSPVISVSTRDDLKPHWSGCALDLDQAREVLRLLAGAIARAEGHRGLAKVRVHICLSLLVMVGGALAMMEAGRPDWARTVARLVA